MVYSIAIAGLFVSGLGMLIGRWISVAKCESVELVHKPHDRRWCMQCNSLVDTDVYFGLYFTDVSCSKCGETIDLIVLPGE